MIVVTPNTFKRGWLDEIEKHGFQFDVHIGNKQEDRGPNFLNLGYHPKGPPVLIINYDAARMPGVIRALQIWAARGKAYLAVDKSIQIKSYKSLQTKAIHPLAPQCAFTRLLTGRPQTQGPHDLWGQLRAIGLYPITYFFAFRGRYCVMGGWNDKEVFGPRTPTNSPPSCRPSSSRPRRPIGSRHCRAKTSPSATMRCRRTATPVQADGTQFLLEIEEGVITVDVAIAKYAKLLRSSGAPSTTRTGSSMNSLLRKTIRGLICCFKSSRRRSLAKSASSTGTGPCSPFWSKR